MAVIKFVLNRKFRASKSPTFHILTVVHNRTDRAQPALLAKS